MPYLSSQDKADCTEFLRELVRIPSLSGQEGRIAARIADEMRRVGFGQVYCDRAGNVVGRIGKGTQRILFNGHMDTVGIGNAAAWQHDPFGAEVIDGVLYGRGAMDMKASLAAMVYGLKTVASDPSALRGEVVLAAVVQEEPYEGVAIRSLIEDEGLWPSFVVLGEPTNLEVALGHRGRVELRVTTEGRACHASAPELGENALYAAAKVIFGIEMLAGNLGEDPRLGKGSIAVTGISCTAGSNNVVPDFCELIVDRRLTLGETRERALTEIRQVIEREGVRGTVRVADRETITYTGHVNRGQEYYPPWLMPDDAPLVKTVVKAVERAIERRPRLKVWAFSTDGAYTRGEAGIPTVGFGPGEERYAHTVNEQVRLADVLLAANGYASIAIEVLNKR